MMKVSQNEHQGAQHSAATDAFTAFMCVSLVSFASLRSSKRRFFRPVRRQVPRVAL